MSKLKHQFVVVVLFNLALIISTYLFIDRGILSPYFSSTNTTISGLLFNPYTRQMEEALARDDRLAAQGLINNLVLLKDGQTNEPLILGLQVELLDKTILHGGNMETGSHKVSQTPLFNPSTMAFLGTVKLIYNDNHAGQVNRNVTYSLLVLVILNIAAVIYIFISFTQGLRPFIKLASINTDPKNLDNFMLPDLRDSVPEEVQRSWNSLQEIIQHQRQQINQLSQENHKLTSMRIHKENQHLEREKPLFLSNVSHELRTPLNAIIGYSELVHEELESLGYSELLDFVDKITLSGQHLLRLINDILDISKMQAGKLDLHIEEFSLLNITEDAIEKLKPLIEKNQIAVNLAMTANNGLLIISDKSKTKQLLFNILNNSTKLTKNGIIDINISVQDNGFVQIVIDDSGIGMSTEQVQALLDPFNPAPYGDQDQQGLEFDLHISRQLCSILGGNMSIQSAIGKGSKVTIDLPVDCRPFLDTSQDINYSLSDSLKERQLSIEHSNSTKKAKHTLLLIDDDLSTQEILTRLLRNLDIEIFFANDKKSGIAKALAIQPDVIVLGASLTDGKCWPLVKNLAQTPRTASIPLVVTSVNNELNTCQQYGIKHFLQKPLNKFTVIQLLETLFVQQEKNTVVIFTGAHADVSLFTYQFENDNWHVIHHQNGETLMDVVNRQLPDLILVDLDSLDSTAITLIRELESKHYALGIITHQRKLKEEIERDLHSPNITIFHKGAQTVEHFMKELYANQNNRREKP